jgi:hypothetical protein
MVSFSNLAYYFEAYGVMDFLLPFLLVFTIIFAVLERIQLFGDESSKRRYNVVVALALGLLFVIPHITGNYPMGYDPVQILNQTLPSISLVAVAAVMVLLLLGVFGRKLGDSARPIIALISIGFVIYIFGAALNFWNGPYDIFRWWSSETTELIIIILIFGLVVAFITKDPNSNPERGKKLMEWVNKLTDK